MENVSVDTGTYCHEILLDFFGPVIHQEEVMHYLSEIVSTLVSGEINPCTEMLMRYVNEAIDKDGGYTGPQERIDYAELG